MNKDAILLLIRFHDYLFGSEDDAQRNTLDSSLLEACDTALNSGLERRQIAESLLHVARMIARNKQEFEIVLDKIAQHYGDTPAGTRCDTTSFES